MPPLRSAHGQALRSRDSTRPDFLLAFWQRRGVTVIGADDAIATIIRKLHPPRPAPSYLSPSHRAPVPVRRLPRGEVAHEQQP